VVSIGGSTEWTDVDDRAIQAARAGLYLASIAADLSAERLTLRWRGVDSNLQFPYTPVTPTS
jgi:hypothetical protein